MSARLPLRGKMICFNPGSLVIWCFANGTTPTHFLIQKRFQVQYHWSEIFYRNFPTNGKCSGFFLRRAAQLRNGITDWWHEQILKVNTRIPVVLERHRSSQGGERWCAPQKHTMIPYLSIHNPTTLVKTLGTLMQQFIKLRHLPPPPSPPPPPPVQCWRYAFKF